MLILSRKIGQGVVIDGGRVKVKITEIHRGQVKLGIEAKGLVIDREEIHERKVRGEPRKGKEQ